MRPNPKTWLYASAMFAAVFIAACSAASPPEELSVTRPSAPAATGEIAHLFELPSARGQNVSLDSCAGEKNVVLVFYRGFW